MVDVIDPDWHEGTCTSRDSGRVSTLLLVGCHSTKRYTQKQSFEKAILAPPTGKKIVLRPGIVFRPSHCAQWVFKRRYYSASFELSVFWKLADITNNGSRRRGYRRRRWKHFHQWGWSNFCFCRIRSLRSCSRYLYSCIYDSFLFSI